MEQSKAILLPLTIIISLFCTSTFADVTGRVVSVTDGDTIKVLDANDVQYKIRLTGIDAPERKQPFGNASRKHLASLVAGKQVKVESDKSDRYGRVLGKVWVDGTDANLEQLKAGYAWWYRYYAKQQPLKDRKAYEKAELNARKERLGLWADPSPINPYVWRKKK
jgi:endonuclease YncB( thermonuclease family)